MSSSAKLTESSDLFVSFVRLLGKTIVLLNRRQWFPKKYLKVQVFFLLFKKVLKMVQCIFEPVARLLNLLHNLG